MLRPPRRHMGEKWQLPMPCRQAKLPLKMYLRWPTTEQSGQHRDSYIRYKWILIWKSSIAPRRAKREDQWLVPCFRLVNVCDGSYSISIRNCNHPFYIRKQRHHRWYFFYKWLWWLSLYHRFGPLIDHCLLCGWDNQRRKDVLLIMAEFRASSLMRTPLTWLHATKIGGFEKIFYTSL